MLMSLKVHVYTPLIKSETNGCPADRKIKCFHQSENLCYASMLKIVSGNVGVFCGEQVKTGYVLGVATF